jgi:phosphoheptose isomerase
LSWDEMKGLIDEVNPEAVECFVKALNSHSDNWIYVAGNGGSAMNAGHFAEDFEAAGFKVIWLGANPGRTLALMNDRPRDDFYKLQMGGFERGDALVLFTVHGCTGSDQAGKWSQNLYRAAELCRSRGGSLFVFSGADGGDLRRFFKGHFLTVKSGDTKLVEPLHDWLFHLVLHKLEAQR